MWLVWLQGLAEGRGLCGVDSMSALGAQDWRPDCAAANPNLPRWFLDDRTDLSARLAGLYMLVLLLWGDADPISPVRVGQRLAELLLRAELHNSLLTGT